MNVFLRRIPANTKHSEISEFFTPVLKNGFFRKSGRILNIEILTLRDTRTGTIEFHGLVALDPEWAVHRALNELKERRLNGRYVLVRPYYHRSWYNDPRQHRDQPASGFIEKRKGDRRRGKFLEIIKNASDRFNSENDFFKAINHQQYMVVFIVPQPLETAVADCLVKFEKKRNPRLTPQDQDHRITRFLTELEGPENKSRRFQFYAEKSDIDSLVENLKTQFPDSGIHYWVMPVVESGLI